MSAWTRPERSRWATPATASRSTHARHHDRRHGAGAGNVISANAQAGVSIQGSASTGIAILGNLIGTDYTGTSRPGQRDFRRGRRAARAGVTIGGTAAGDRNIISGNTGAGIGLVAGTTGELIEGNLIGTDITGSNPLGNGTGIQIDGGSSNNTIGGTPPAPATRSPSSHGHRRGRRRHGRGRQRDPAQLDLLEHRAGDRPGRRRRHLEQLGRRTSAPTTIRTSRCITAVTTAGGTTTVTGTLQQHAEHHVRARFLHAVVDERLGLRRGPVPARLGRRHDRRLGQRQLLVRVPDPCAAGPSS